MSEQDSFSDSNELEDLEHQLREKWNSHSDVSFQTQVSGEMVLKRIRGRRIRHMALSLAATLLIGFALWNWILPQAESKFDQNLNQSLVWLKKEQLPKGHWDTVKWGGKERFTVGVSALALMSIMQLEDSSDSSAIRKTLGYLESQQGESGLIGPEFLGDLYNHSLAILALKKARSMGFEVSEKIIQKAETHLLKFKGENGLFSYREGMAPEKNLSEWATLALKGRKAYDLNWSASQESHSTTFASGFENETRPDAMDLFFKQLLQPEASKEAQALMDFQEKHGELTGSWPVEGKWSHVGGRVFTTGMAILCVKPLTI